MIYSIIRSKGVFYQLANLPEDSYQLSQRRHQPRLLSQQTGQAADAIGGGSGATPNEHPSQPQEGKDTYLASVSAKINNQEKEQTFFKWRH